MVVRSLRLLDLKSPVESQRWTVFSKEETMRRASPSLSSARRAAIVFCLIGTLHVPLLLWARNQTIITRPIVPFAIYTALGVLIFLSVQRLGRTGGHIGLMIGFLLTSAGPSATGFPGGTATTISLAGLGALIVWRLGTSSLAKGFLLATAMYMFLVPAYAFANARLNWGDSMLPKYSPLDFGENRHEGDVLLVVMDALGGPISLRDEFAFDLQPTLNRLIAAGFQSPVTFASDSTTQTSVASSLLMQYSVRDRTTLNSATLAGLREVIAGDNELVRAFRYWNYEITMVESGWGISRCGPAIDHCVPAPIFDDALAAIAENSVVAGHLEQHFGSGFSQGTLATRSWLLEDLPELLINGRNDLIFTHLMAPHPPLFLDSNCKVRGDERYSGLGLWRPGDTPAVIELRKNAFLDQVRCVVSIMDALIPLLTESTSVILLGDHGSDASMQLATEPVEWSTRQILFRQNVFFAARLPAGCALPERTVLPNVIRATVSCLGSTDLLPLENRVFLTVSDLGSTVVELPNTKVVELLSST